MWNATSQATFLNRPESSQIARASSNSTVRIKNGLYDQISAFATGSVSNCQPFKTEAVNSNIPNNFSTILFANFIFCYSLFNSIHCFYVSSNSINRFLAYIITRMFFLLISKVCSGHNHPHCKRCKFYITGGVQAGKERRMPKKNYMRSCFFNIFQRKNLLKKLLNLFSHNFHIPFCVGARDL